MADVRIDVRYDGIERVQESIDRFLDAIKPPSLTESVGKGADEFVTSLQDAAPVKSGELRGSIDKFEVSPTKFQIGPRGVIYAAIQNHGGTVHSSRPGGYLKISDSDFPEYVKSVRIPGTHYMDKGFDAGLEPAAEAVKADIIAKIDS